eukprot:15473901-Alexandrium_andersonii.AAC.1
MWVLDLGAKRPARIAVGARMSALTVPAWIHHTYAPVRSLKERCSEHSAMRELTFFALLFAALSQSPMVKSGQGVAEG